MLRVPDLSPPVDPHRLPSDDVLTALSVDAHQGLAPDDAALRLSEYGPNELAAAPRVPAW